MARKPVIKTPSEPPPEYRLDVSLNVACYPATYRAAAAYHVRLSELREAARAIRDALGDEPPEELVELLDELVELCTKRLGEIENLAVGMTRPH